jgi:hypothetical protein
MLDAGVHDLRFRVMRGRSSLVRRLLAPVCCCLLATRPLAAQVLSANTVPTAVRHGYAGRFPGARKTEWKLKTDRNYEAEFELNGVGIAAKFDSTGAWLETESDIKPGQVPGAVGRAIARDFKGYQVIERQRLEPRTGPTVYEIHLENAKEILKTQFDSSGRLVARSSKPRK